MSCSLWQVRRGLPSTGRDAALLAVASLAAVVGACSSDADDSATTADTPGSVATTATAPAEAPSTESTPATDPDDGDPWTEFRGGGSASGAPAASDADCTTTSPSPGAPVAESVELVELGTTDGVRVSAAEYPLADTEGNPWSQWGEGVTVPDGRFVSAVGDHLGQDGTTWFYEYDPSTNQLSRTVEVSEFLGHEAGDWGYGKIHAPMVLDADCTIVTATYWGSRRGIEASSYEGDHLVRYNPTSRAVDDLGIPVEGFGIPSLSISPDRRWIYGEAVDPSTDPAVEPDQGVLFIADASTGEVVHIDDRDDHYGFRDLLVTPDGEALYAMPEGRLGGVRADGSERVVDAGLPGDWLRTATPTRSGGPAYGATRDPDALFAYEGDGTTRDLGELEGYIASIALSPDGRTLYYVPGAHGDGPELGGTPLIAVDTATGDREVVVRLNDLVEPALGVVAGGSFNVVADPSGDRVYVGLNGGESGSDESYGRVVLAVVDL